MTTTETLALAGSRPGYVYVASSWRNPMQEVVCGALTAAGIDHYDFKNPPGGTGFSWREVKSAEPAFVVRLTCGHEVPTTWADRWASPRFCGECNRRVTSHGFDGFEQSADGQAWIRETHAARQIKAKGSDWELVDEYLRMVSHPAAIAGFDADFAAMERADTFVLVLPCGKSAHLELGWAVGAGKRTAILLEDPVEPELMYRMVDYMAPSLVDLLGWLGVRDEVAA